MLLASAFVSYIGCFNKRFRGELMDKTFLPYLKGEIPPPRGGVPMSDSDRPAQGAHDRRADCRLEHRAPPRRSRLDRERLHCQLVRALAADDRPAAAGHHVDQEARGEARLKVVRLGQKTLMQQLSSGIENGIPVMIENIQLRSTRCSTRSSAVRRSSAAATSSSSSATRRSTTTRKFKLYLQTKLSNPHYPPEIQAETTLDR